MISAAFTLFRKKTASYLDKVENGESVVITRHGKPVAEIIPVSPSRTVASWKKQPPPMSIRGVSLSRAILCDRNASRG